jgi:hypothetical protein
MDFDLSQLDTQKGADEGFELTLVHPKTGERLPMVITLLGYDSAAYQDAMLDQQRVRFKEMQKSRRREMTPEELDAAALELLVVATRAWRGMKLDGTELACTPENARTVYRRFPWIREQANEAIGDRANFLPCSSKS